MTNLRVAGMIERLRGSLFFVPMVFVVGGVALAETTLTVDRSMSVDGTSLPFRLTSTVDSARSILETVAGATITFAGIAFSVALLIFQLTSSQYSPRVVHGLFRDPFNKQVMGVVVGTFTYCLLVLRTVRSPIESGNDPVIPHLSVGVAVVLGIGTVLAIVAFIDHAAHRMDVSQILHDVTARTLDGLGKRRRSHDGALLCDPPADGGFTVVFDENGWIQQFHEEAFLALTSPGGTVRFDATVGRYAIAGTALCTVWPVPPPGDRDRVVREARDAVRVGEARTMQQDHAYGLRQIVDVALRALSPGVNDPTTAQDAIFHATATLRELLQSPPAVVVRGAEGRRLLLPEAGGLDDLVDLAYDEIRLAAATQPTVCIYLLEAMRLLMEAVDRDGLPLARGPILRQAGMVVASVERSDLPPADIERVRSAHAVRFRSPAP